MISFHNNENKLQRLFQRINVLQQIALIYFRAADSLQKFAHAALKLASSLDIVLQLLNFIYEFIRSNANS